MSRYPENNQFDIDKWPDENDESEIEKVLFNRDSNSFLRKKTKYRPDNIRSKIINHFSNFIINFLNDYVKKQFHFEKVVFVKTNYNERKKVDIKSISSFMNLTIKDFCSMNISSKIKTYSSNHNIQALNEVKDSFESDFVNQKLSKFYENFYLNKKNILKDFNLSDSTRNFSFLLKEKDLEQKYIQKINDTGMNLVTEFINKKHKTKKFGNKKLDSTDSNIILNPCPLTFFSDSETSIIYDDNSDFNPLNSNYLY